jgi:hypothetical protein
MESNATSAVEKEGWKLNRAPTAAVRAITMLSANFVKAQGKSTTQTTQRRHLWTTQGVFYQCETLLEASVSITEANHCARLAGHPLNFQKLVVGASRLVGKSQTCPQKAQLLLQGY